MAGVCFSQRESVFHWVDFLVSVACPVKCLDVICKEEEVGEGLILWCFVFFCRCLVHIVRSTSLKYSKIRQFQEHFQFDVCRHEVRYGCLREDSCHFAHSFIELKVWLLQQYSGEYDLAGVVYTWVSSSVYSGPVERGRRWFWSTEKVSLSPAYYLLPPQGVSNYYCLIRDTKKRTEVFCEVIWLLSIYRNRAIILCKPESLSLGTSWIN